MHHRIKSLAFAAVLSVSALSSTAFAQPADTVTESQHYEKGVGFFRAGAFDAAVIEFEAAYKAGGNFKHLYNIGVCRQELKDFPAALDAYTKYIAEGGASIEAKRKEEVNEQIAQLKGLVRHVNLQTHAPAGTEVFVDDVKIGVVPLAPFSVKVGQRKISMTFGSQVATKVLPIASGTTDTVVELDFTEAAPASSGGTEKSEVPVKEEPPSFPIIPWAITGALGVGAIAFDVLAVSSRNAQGTLEGTLGVNPQEIKDKASSASSYALVGDLFTVGAIGAALVSTYFTIRYVSKKNAAQVGIGPGSFLVGGSF